MRPEADPLQDKKEKGAGRSRQRKKREGWTDYVGTVLIAMIAVFGVNTFLFELSRIPTGSMLDTLLVGDHLVLNKFVFPPAGEPLSFLPQREIERGDIVAFKFPKEPTKIYVKRVIALPGEEIRIEGKRVFIDGAELEEPYKVLKDKRRLGRDVRIPERDDLAPKRVPAGSYFLMGDNRDFSNDSREFGPIDRTLIIGRPVVILWSAPTAKKKKGTNPFSRLWWALGEVRWGRSFKMVE